MQFRFSTHLRDAGFECEIFDPLWLFKAHRNAFYVDLITGMSNAAIMVEESWIERSVPKIVPDGKTRVLAAEELLVSKLFIARRERFDGADVARIIYGTRGKIDWRRVLELTGQHWEILPWALVLFRYAYRAQTYHVPAEVRGDLLSRFREAVSHPDPKARFRSRLVNETMFAIEVNEMGWDNLIEEYHERRLRNPPAID